MPPSSRSAEPFPIYQQCPERKLRALAFSYEALGEIDEGRPSLPPAVREQVEINLKYEGYLKRQESQVRQFKKLEGKRLPEDFDYEAIKGLRKEAMQKLNQLRPVNIGQASRISGVSPADISVLLVYLEQRKNH